MTSPDPDSIASMFAGIEKIPTNAISSEDNMGGNVICAPCWLKWMKEDVDWRTQHVEVVTVYDGKALCQDHFLASLAEVKANYRG